MIYIYSFDGVKIKLYAVLWGFLVGGISII